jgi:biotin carboxylase
LDRVDSLNEHWLGLEAKLREDFNIEGPKPGDTSRNRSKTSMREIFRQAGVSCTEGERVSSSAQVRAFAKAHGFPLVLKPDVGVGAYRTFKVKSAAELDKALEENLDGYVVEHFVQGELLSFDGLTNRDGEIVFFTSHVYSGGIMDIVIERLDVHYWSQRELSKTLEEVGRRAVKAFGVRERFFHLELFQPKQEQYVALEINVRPPGGFTTDLMNYACDFDIYDLWARVLTGDPLKGFTYARKYHTAHASRRAGRRYALTHEALLSHLGDALVLHQEVPPIFSGAMGNYMYLLRHPDLAVLQEHIAAVERPAP